MFPIKCIPGHALMAAAIVFAFGRNDSSSFSHAFSAALTTFFGTCLGFIICLLRKGEDEGGDSVGLPATIITDGFRTLPRLNHGEEGGAECILK